MSDITDIIQCWLEQPHGIHLRSVSEKGEAVTLTAEEARSIARELIELSLRLDYHNTNDPENRDWIRIPMQYISFRVVQDPTFEHEEIVAGAVVECWIKDETWKNAIFVAQGWIEESGWFIEELTDQVEAVREDYEDDHRLAYYDQAITDEQVFLYNIYDSED